MKLDLIWEAPVSDRVGVWGWPSSEVSLCHMAYARDVSILSSSLQCSLFHILPPSQRRWVVWHISYWRLEYHITKGCSDNQDLKWAPPKCVSCLRYLTWLYRKHDNTLSLVLDCVSQEANAFSSSPDTLHAVAQHYSDQYSNKICKIWNSTVMCDNCGNWMKGLLFYVVSTDTPWDTHF